MTSMTVLLKIAPSVLGLILLSFTSVFGQEVMKIKHSCNFSDEETETEHYVFEASNEATKIVNTLLQASGLSANGFILKEADCKNALATTEGRKRYILYNPVFLQKFKMDAKSKWVGYCVLAHEIAHHLNNHDLETDDPSVRKRQELEADKFAGHWLAKMGASLEDAQAGIQALPLENESKTHPPKNARLVAVTNGWTKSKDMSSSTVENTVPDQNSTPNQSANPKKAAPKVKKQPNPADKTNQTQRQEIPNQNSSTNSNNNPAPPTGFRVIEAMVRVDPQNSTGPCPQKITVRARISVVGGAGTVSYKWLRNDGASAPIETIKFDGPGSKDIEFNGYLGATGSEYRDFWHQLEIFDPVSMLSNKAYFTLICR